MRMTPTQRVEILRACCCIAGADGETTPYELAQIKQLAEAEGVGEASLNAMIERAEKDPDFFKQQFTILKSEPLICLDALLRTCIANGLFKKSEYRVLKGLAQQLEIDSSEFKAKVSAILDEQTDA